MKLTREHVETMIQHARAGLPNEACGLLAGTGDTVSAVYCLENADHSPYTYELTAEGYRLLLELDDAGTLLGVFHSHTGSPAYPSPTDRRQAFWPIRYVVISLQDDRRPVVGVYHMTKRDLLDAAELARVTEEELEIV